MIQKSAYNDLDKMANKKLKFVNENSRKLKNGIT